MHAEAGLSAGAGRRSRRTGAGPAQRCRRDRRGTVSTDGDILVIELASTTIGLTSTAKEVAAAARSIRVEGDEPTYTLLMGAMGLPPRAASPGPPLHRQP